MIQDGTLIFIPYQDTDNFYSDGILTREFAMLYLLYNMGFKHVINVKKPRTFLDSPRYVIHDEKYPKGTIENQVKSICDSSCTIQYHPLLSVEQVLKKRCWWANGYLKNVKQLTECVVKQRTIVYSDNPFASSLLRELKLQGAFIFFDIMDNFAIHPSLNSKEHEGALKGYKEIVQFSDIVSANSEQTSTFIKKKTSHDVVLVKNGVFENNDLKIETEIPCIELINSKKQKYKRCVGYIGKLGGRLDAELIDTISAKCKDTLFVFVGGYLKGQINEKLLDLFDNRENVLHVDPIPSAYVYSVMETFDILSIPHAVGKAENGGDPLKLYQYMTRSKPIITTGILGVDEFKKQIYISNDAEEWIKFINTDHDKCDYSINFSWQDRLYPVRSEIEKHFKI